MAKARTLIKRRNSIRSIRKITRTMELISTAQFQRAMQRAVAATDYTRRIVKLVGDLAKAGHEVRHPLLEERAETHRAALLVLTANRGLCGGYNSSILRLAMARLKELRGSMDKVHLEVSGKRGVSSFRFRKIEPDEKFLHFEDKPAFAEVEVIANRYLQWYEAGEIDRLDVIYTNFQSLSRRESVVETLLPMTALADPKEPQHIDEDVEYDFLPSAADILDEVVPTSFKTKLFKCFLDAAVSEQVARMLAMKAATENADSMISHLTMVYNRARQGQITGELLEIIGGADAISG